MKMAAEFGHAGTIYKKQMAKKIFYKNKKIKGWATEKNQKNPNKTNMDRGGGEIVQHQWNTDFFLIGNLPPKKKQKERRPRFT